MQAVIDHLRTLASRTAGTAGEDPTDPAVGRRCAAQAALADLLADDVEMVRPSTRRAIEAFLLPPLPDEPVSSLSPRAGALLMGHGADGPPTTAAHLRLLDALAAALVADVWDVVRVTGDVVLDGAMTPTDLSHVVDLHLFEVEAALAGVEPGDEYFRRRARLSEGEREAALRACAGQARESRNRRTPDSYTP